MRLTMENVTKRVGRATHIADVNLHLEPGSVNVLLGPTLAGKTTLMRLMAGLDRPTSGRVLVDGRDVTGEPVQKRDVAMVYQQFINYPSLTVYENIASPLRVRRRPEAEVDRRVQEAAALLKLGPYLQRTPLALSGGQQQRTALARALVKDASLVLLDEPLANLDYKLREELREELPRVFAASGAVFVYATTEPTEALLLGGSTATLHEGRVTQFGPTIEVYRQPADRLTAETFSDPPMNFVPATVEGGLPRLADGTVIPAVGPLAGLPSGPIELGFRPNHLSMTRQSPSAVALPVTVTVVEITGSESFVHLRYGGLAWVALMHGVHEFEPGDAATCYVDPVRMFVFGTDGRLIAAPTRAAAA